MTHFVQSAFAEASLDVCHQIHPKGYLGAIEGCLLDDALGTVCDIGDDDIVGLIGCIAEEIALEHGLCSAERTFQQLVIHIDDGLQLLCEGKT